MRSHTCTYTQHVGVWWSKSMAPPTLIVDFYPRPLYPCKDIPRYPLNRGGLFAPFTGLERTAIPLLSSHCADYARCAGSWGRLLFPNL